MVVPTLHVSSRSSYNIRSRRLQFIALLGFLFLNLQYFNILGFSFFMDAALNFFRVLHLQDPGVAWISPFYADFPYSLTLSEDCQKVLHDSKLLPGIAKASNEKKAQTDWLAALKACHGPLPEHNLDAMEELSLDHFWKKLKSCPTEAGDCLPNWSKAIKGKTGRKLQRLFVETARCALLTEYPLMPPKETTLPTLRQKKPDWKPKRIVLLSLTLGQEGPTMACRLVSTALTRGWNLTIVEGPMRGLEYKFSDALAALQGVLDMERNVKPQDTLVIFTDAKDMLMQQTPDIIADKYLSQPYEFLLSAEGNPYPIGKFPHSIAAREYITGHLFPRADLNGPQYVNTGGWVATGSAAAVVLKELVQFLHHHSKTDGHCVSWGTDQLLGNMAFLRHRSLIGLDYNSEIFSGGSWDLIGKELILNTSTNKTQNLAYCHHHKCPGMLHFNGRSNAGGTLDSAFQVLTSHKAIQRCPPSRDWGTLTVVRRTKGTIKTIYKDVNLQKSGHHAWNKCLAGKACFGK